MATADPAVTAPADGHRPEAQPAGADDGRALTIRLEGRLDALRALALRAELDEVVGKAAPERRDVIVDLTDVTFLDSAALAALVRLRRQCADAVVDLKLVKPRQREALRIFWLTKFDEVFVMLDGVPS